MECRTCWGEGIIESQFNELEDIPCPRCKGTGKEPIPPNMGYEKGKLVYIK